MKKSPALSLTAVALVLLITLLSCQGLNAPGTSLVTITIGAHQTATLEIRESTLLLQLKRSLGRFLAPKTAAAQVPQNVTDVRVTVSAADLQPIVLTERVAGLDTVSIDMEVPNGMGRHFLVEGLTSGGATAYQGQTRTDLTGVPVSLTVLLTPVNPGDTTPPTFAGLQSATALSSSSMQLSWTTATDTVSSSAAIIYYIYQSTTPGGEVYSTPTYITPAGALNYTATGLTPGTDYYFVVRARDEAGNIDTNTVERSGTTTGLYVNVASGNDNTGTGTQALPYKTIAKALSVTAGNESIFVAQGNYSVGSGETFPLQLKAGTSLVCTGAQFSTVIDNSSGPDSTIILGEAGASIDGCGFYTFTSSGPASNLPAVDDGGFAMTVQNCSVVDGDLSGRGTTGINLSGNSTVRNSTITGFIGSDGGGAGIRTSGDALVTVNTISGSWQAIYVSSGTSTVSNNTLTNNTYGMNILGGRPTVINNVISFNTNYGLVTQGTTTPFIAGNTITNNGQGLSLWGGNPTITGNFIHDNTNGIYVIGGTPSINNNSLYCNNTVSTFINYGDIYVAIPLTAGLMTNNAWDHDGLTRPQGPTIGLFSTNGCPVGTDICVTVTPPSSSYTPFSPAVAGGCL